MFLARYVSASLDAIAEEAGFSKGVVYSRFASKADMFLSLLEARIAERAEQNERLAAGRDGKDLAEDGAPDGVARRGPKMMGS